MQSASAGNLGCILGLPSDAAHCGRWEKTRQIQVTAVVEPARFAQHRQQIEGIMQSARCREPSGSAQAR